MPRVSRAPLQKDKVEELSENFSFLISSLNKKSDIDNFFQEFLTREEKIMLFKRLMLFILMTKEYPEIFIKSSLNLSHETIRTYKNQLPVKSEQFNTIIRKLLSRNQTKNFLKKLEKILDVINTISKSKTNMKARSKISSGQWH